MIRRPPRSTLFPYTTPFRPRPRPRPVQQPHPGQPPPRFTPLPPPPPPPTAGPIVPSTPPPPYRLEEHTPEPQSPAYFVCRLLLVKKKNHVLTASVIVLPSRC